MKNLQLRSGDQRGFNLIELMIVIAVMGLLIGIGTFGWTAVIRAGNEAAASQAIDNIRKFQAHYASGNRGAFGTFEQLIAEASLDPLFKGEAPVVNGYRFTLTVQQRSPGKTAFYAISAEPDVPAGVTATGTRRFYFDSSLSTIRSTKENRPATADDQTL